MIFQLIVSSFGTWFWWSYIDRIYDNTRVIVEFLGLEEDQYTNTWQSESDIGIPWIKPDVLEYLHDEHPDHYILFR